MILPRFRNVLFARNVSPRQNFYCVNRPIGTTSQGSHSTVTVDEAPKTEERKTKKRLNLNWKSYGFDYVDQRNDIFFMHLTSFSLVTIFFWGGFLTLFYYPDVDDNDWTHREAYIQLRRREMLGLPLVDKNYVDPALITLPPDEELGDGDIII